MATNGSEGGTSSVAADPELHWISNPSRSAGCNSDLVVKTRTKKEAVVAVPEEVNVDTAVDGIGAMVSTEAVVGTEAMFSTETKGGDATEGAHRPGPRPDRLRPPPATPVPAVLSLSIAKESIAEDVPVPHDRWCEGPTHGANVCSVLLLCLALLTLALYAVLQCVPAVTEGKVNLKLSHPIPPSLCAASPRSHSPPPDSIHSFAPLVCRAPFSPPSLFTRISRRHRSHGE